MNPNRYKKQLEEHYKEILNLIPSIQEATLKALQRIRNFHGEDKSWVKQKASLYNNIFDIIQGKWSVEIYFTLMILESCGFNDLKRLLPRRNGKEINSRTLTDRLQFLEKRRVIARHVITESPVRVNYALTDFGKESFALLLPFLVYSILPSKIKREYPKIGTMEELIRQSITQEAE